MEQVDLAIIKKKSLQGVVALTSRTFLLQIIAFFATFLLTIFLAPATFGIFYVVSAVINFLGYFSDIGLAAALIQKKEELTREDLVTTFTIQQLLVVAVTIGALLLSPTISGFYGLGIEGIWLLRSLIFAFFLSSLKTIPSVLLERRLDFTKLIIPQVLETLGFYVVAVILAWRGFGVTSFTWAVLTRAILGLVAMYVVSPWSMGFGISSPVAKRLLRFGLPFQLNSLLALVKDDLLTVFLGKALPFAQVGYIGWAKKWAEVPLRLIMDSVVRVTFPAFSRLQHSKKLIGTAIDNTLFGLAVTILPISTGLLFFVRPMVGLIPRYGKWEPALFSFFIFVIASAISSLSTPLSNALNAVGKIKVTLSLMVLWTTSTWLLTVLFLNLFGYNGVSIALLVITSTLALVIHLTKQIADFHFIENVKTPLLSVFVQGTFYALVIPRLAVSFPSMIIVGVLGLALYALVVWKIEKSRITGLVAKFRT